MGSQIGQKLKAARCKRNLTQEAAAEALGVSRQTVSNWENERSYPDVVSVIKMSDLYSVSLDALLKGDRKMIEHLEESTNVVKSGARLRKVWQIVGYAVIWAAALLAYWLIADPGDAMGYALLAFFIVLPAASLVDSVLIGTDGGWGRGKWLAPLLFGALSMLLELATFWLGNGLTFAGRRNPPSWTMFLLGTGVSLLGVALGSGGKWLAGYLRRKNDPPKT